MDNMAIQLVTTQADFDANWGALTGHDVEVKGVTPLTGAVARGSGKARFVDPITAVMVVSAASLGFRIFEYFRKRMEQGVQIDLQTTPPTFSVIANVPQGFIVIIDKDGQAQTLQANYDKSEEITALLAKLLGAGKT